MTVAVFRIGIVYYQCDPHKGVFRFVYPTRDNSELDDPQWIRDGCNPDRVAVLEKVAPDDPRVLAGFTGTP